MPYIITNLCTNDGACVEVCPVACIHTKPGAPQFYVDPEVCIDCEQCEIVCPVDAIFKDVDIPAQYTDAIEVNAAFFRQNKAAIGPVPFDTAWAMIQSRHEYAQMVGAAVTAVVVDEAGAPIAVGKMDKAEPSSAELAFNKAYTAAAFHVSTATLVPQARQPWLCAAYDFAPWQDFAHGRRLADRQRRHHRRRHRRRRRQPPGTRRVVLPRRHVGVGKRRSLIATSRNELSRWVTVRCASLWLHCYFDQHGT